MRTSTVESFTQILNPLTTITAGSFRTRREHNAIIVYRAEGCATGAVAKAVEELVRAGKPVRVYEGTSIFTPFVDAQGTLVWHQRPTPRKRNYTAIEVTL